MNSFGLIRNTIIAELLLYYILLADYDSRASAFLFKEYERATCLVFFILCIYFFFGAVKDALKETFAGQFLGRYSIALPIVLLLISVSFSVLKKNKIFSYPCSFVYKNIAGHLPNS
jgi:hypothetical protein